MCYSILKNNTVYAYFDSRPGYDRGQKGIVGRLPEAIRFIGISEIADVVGIIHPCWIGTSPFLTPFAASCFALIMLLAAPIHYKLEESRNEAVNLLLLVISLFLAWGRSQQLYLSLHLT